MAADDVSVILRGDAGRLFGDLMGIRQDHRGPFSAIIAVGVLVLPEVMVGMTEASTTRSPASP